MADAPSRWLGSLAGVLAGVLLVACDAASPAPAATPDATPGASAATPPSPAVALDLGPDEAASLRAAFTAAGFAVREDAAWRLSDTPASGAERYVLTAYALIAHPRSDVLDLTDAEARGVLDGTITDWEQLGGRARPLRLFVGLDRPPVGLAAALGVAVLAGQAIAPDEAVARVASDPGAIALVPAGALRPGVLALTIGGHDPYRDRWADAPLADVRWILAPPAQQAQLLAIAGWQASPPRPVGVLATGELMLARCTGAALAEADAGDDAAFDDTRDLIEAAALAVAPIESAIVDAEATPCTRTFTLQADAGAAGAIARAGYDVALVIGNHIGDCWSGCGAATAIEDTLANLQDAGLVTAGAGADLDEARAPVLVDAGGVRFAFLGYDDIASGFYAATDDSPGSAPLDLATLADDVRAAKDLADHVIVGMNWGVEYTAVPTARQREAARIAVDAGASLVIGNHPHWTQAVEWVDGGFVAYALGNFVFDQDWSEATMQGLILEAGFTRERLMGVRLRPIAIRGETTPEAVDPASGEGQAVLRRVFDAADSLSPR